MMNKKLRSHQWQLNQVIDGIINRHPKYAGVKRIILSVVPGGGKGSVPVNAGKLIKAGLADRICCIVPRKSLQTQCEEVCMDTFFQQLFETKISLRASTNDWNPCRGLHGFVTTYQALGHDKNGFVVDAVKERRTIVILDEFHHVEEDSPWHRAVAEIIEAATFVIMMSGTLSRANKKKIAIVEYRNGYVDLSGDDKTRVIRYSRTDALREQAVLPIIFHLHDGSFEWKEFDKERVHSVDSFKDVKKTDRASALFTALQTEFADQLIDQSLAHWLETKKNQPGAKILFVCARIGDAKRCIEHLKGLGIPALLATSHESDVCTKNIAAFKGKAPVLVTIAVAYEGLDVPPISHVCVLTRIRSAEWLEQCVFRATRWDRVGGMYRDQQAHIFAPRDQAFMEFVGIIEKEQVTRALPVEKREGQLDLFLLPDGESGGGGAQRGPCIPLRSEILALSKKILGGNESSPWEPIVNTPKQEEHLIRRDIDRYLKRYARQNGYEIQQVNKDVKARISKTPRAEMTMPELKHLFTKIQDMYPMDSGSLILVSHCPPVPAMEQRPFSLTEQKFF